MSGLRLAVRPHSVTFMEQGIAVLRMTRGENRINAEFIDSFHNCLDQVESNKSCRGLITTGEGKFFSNGLDLKWIQQQDMPVLDQFMGDFHEMVARLLVFPMPTVAAINGHAFAGGALLAMAYDCRVMNNQRGWICLNEVHINLRLGDFALKYVQAKLTPSVFHNMLVFGRKLTGSEAEAAGVIDKAAPPLELEKEAEKMLTAWAGKDGIARNSLQNMKKDVYAEALKDIRSHRFKF